MAWYDLLLPRKDAQSTDLVKARSSKKKKNEPISMPKSWDLEVDDWWQAMAEMGLGGANHQGTAGIAYDTLRQMARVPLVSAIINTRVNQIAEFAIPQQTPYSLGFRIVHREDKEPSKEILNKIEEITRWVQTCGDPRLTHDSRFETFLRKIMRDSMLFDQACFEVVRTKGGKIAGMVAVDASTVRRAKLSDKERKQGRRDHDKTGFVQVLSSKVVAEFKPDEMIFGVRRPRTWLQANGYGYPELEELVRVITNLLNAESYNAANFNHGMHTAGILAVKSKMNPQLFRAFRREFYSMLSGAGNAHKTPIIQLDPENKEELQSINMSATNREMEYQEWLSFLLRQCTMVFQMDPAELGYQFGNENQSSAMTTGGVGDKLSYSRERGLRPILRAMQSWINEGIIHQIDADYDIEFVGFDAMTEGQKLDMDIKAVQNYKTINEMRAEYDLEKLESPVADMVMNASYMNTASMMQAQADAQAEEGAEGGPDMADPEAENMEGFDEPDDDFDIDSLFANAGFDDKAEDEAVTKAMRVKSVTVEVE